MKILNEFCYVVSLLFRSFYFMIQGTESKSSGPHDMVQGNYIYFYQ